MTEQEANAIITKIRYKDTHSLYGEHERGFVRLWWAHRRPDRTTGELEVGMSGSVILKLSELTEESLVRSIWGMTLRLEEHECREFFMYGDERPFDPHKELI